MGAPADPLAGREIILECNDYGDVVRVNAVDAATGLEASASGPPTARHELEKMALKKLSRQLFGDPPPPGDPKGAAPGRGKLV